jgi:hypothetical protein
MRQTRENPPGEPAGSLNASLPGSLDGPEITQNGGAGQRKIPLTALAFEALIDDIGCNAGVMIECLNCVLAHRDAGDVIGLIYSVKRAQCYWRAIVAGTRDLKAAEAARQSAFRQAEGGAP